MEPDKNNSETTESGAEQQAPSDALSRTPEELNEEAEKTAAETPAVATEQPAEKKLSPIKRIFRKINLYFLIFLLLVVVAGAIAIVSYLNSQNSAPEASIATQGLTEEALKQLANTDTSVGNTSQTLTIQGNTVIKGQSLMHGSLSVASTLQTGGGIRAPGITISGDSNLGKTQINSLQVAENTAIQGDTTLRNLNVSGTTSLSGAVTASKITVSQLILSGNAVLQVPNHISFTGPAPGRTILNANALGSGGTVSVSSNGSDTSGTININTGGSPSSSPGCFVRVNFRQAFSKQPRVILSPVNEAAGKMQYYVQRNTSSFSLCSVNALTGGSSFAFDYFVAG